MNQRHFLYAAVLVVGLLAGYGIAQQVGSLREKTGEAVKAVQPIQFMEEGDKVQLTDEFICCCLNLDASIIGASEYCFSREGSIDCGLACSVYGTNSWMYAEW